MWIFKGGGGVAGRSPWTDSCARFLPFLFDPAFLFIQQSLNFLQRTELSYFILIYREQSCLILFLFGQIVIECDSLLEL